MAILAGLFIADVATTEYIIQNGGSEQNPAMMKITESPANHFILKAGVFGLIAYAVIYSNREIKNAGSFALCILVTWYMIVIGHNIEAIF